MGKELPDWIKELLKEYAMDFIKDIANWVAKEKPFGIVHDAHPIKLDGKSGLLVWDYIVWNELTFVDSDTKEKQSLFNNISDKKTREKFDEYVSKYGI